MGAAPALAEGTAGVELAGKAESHGCQARHVWVPWAQGVAGSKVKMPPQGGERELDVVPPEGERECCATPQHNPNEGKHEPIWLPGGAL